MGMTTAQGTDRVLPLRKLIHLAGAAFPLLYFVASRQIVLLLAFILLVLTVAIEWGRQRWDALERVFEWAIGPALRRGEESRPTTGTWATLGILFTVMAFRKEFAIPAMLYAQVGDPAAEVVGRSLGRRRMLNGKTLEGSLGCFGANLVTALICCQVLPLSPGVAVLGALVAAVAEAIPLPIGDNLIMAPLSGLAMTLAAWMVG
jgi:dolichol kinase